QILSSMSNRSSQSWGLATDTLTSLLSTQGLRY
ncbi:MAG: hypothetical protein K0Q62_1270, partial [Phenylobacterium sp.]|nr:hypothetical protein [Phenylobacterium sp.]